MRIAQVIGSVTLSRVHPTLVGGTYKVCVPLLLDEIAGRSPITSEDLVMYDALGAGHGSLVALTEGAEAAQPFRPADKPVDAYCAALLDTIEVDPDLLRSK